MAEKPSLISGEANISLRLLLSILGLFVTVCVVLVGMFTWFVDAKISDARSGIASDMSPIVEGLRESNRLLERRLFMLEQNVQDRWSATNMYQFAMELYESLRKAGIDFEPVDPLEIRNRSAAR